MKELRLTDLSFSRDQRVLLNKVNMSLVSSGITCITGSNGTGKSTFLQLLHGIIKPESGSVQWIGYNSQPKMAMVFQKPLMLRRTVLANIQFILNLQKNSADPLEYLQQLNLAHLAQKPARSLSGGEQQKLEIARVLALQPEIILLDEPTANLDPQTSVQIEQLLMDLSAQGKKIICASHDMQQVQRIAEDILHLQNAQLEHRHNER
jgi:tungstate transport system ATP-binding protein